MRRPPATRPGLHASTSRSRGDPVRRRPSTTDAVCRTPGCRRYGWQTWRTVTRCPRCGQRLIPQGWRWPGLGSRPGQPPLSRRTTTTDPPAHRRETTMTATTKPLRPRYPSERHASTSGDAGRSGHHRADGAFSYLVTDTASDNRKRSGVVGQGPATSAGATRSRQFQLYSARRS
jgi:hypothetical protein